ncbi:hypothetical protein AYI82_20385 [Shewanella algae]|uniref:hypothetical protein n=1 Tax=Shewanella algae TaxID=38313 RepID=UPI001184063F|nr:hypothetical protein [Shewanella algae]TVL02875.1 hypothetical protein AYI82_20385 [Shewanella algae]
MEFTSSQHIFKPGIFQVAGNLQSSGILTLGIFQISVISRILCILMAGSSKHFLSLASSLGHLQFFTQQVVSSMKSEGHFLFSIHASGVSMWSNFRLAHNKAMHMTFGNCHAFCAKKRAIYLGL